MTMQEQLADTVTGDEAKAVHQLVDRLAARFPQVPVETVETLVRSVHEELADAPLRNFIPLLVEHDVLIQLRAATSGVAPARERVRRDVAVHQ